MNEEQKKRAILIWQKYCQKRKEHSTIAGEEFTFEQRDQRRIMVISEVLSVLQNYLSGKTQLDEFKTFIDGINKRNGLWGFRGANGQMFFNMLTKTSLAGNKIGDLENLLKKSLPLPTSLEQAAHILDEFALFTKSLGKFVEDRHGAAKNRCN